VFHHQIGASEAPCLELAKHTTAGADLPRPGPGKDDEGHGEAWLDPIHHDRRERFAVRGQESTRSCRRRSRVGRPLTRVVTRTYGSCKSGSRMSVSASVYMLYLASASSSVPRPCRLLCLLMTYGLIKSALLCVQARRLGHVLRVREEPFELLGGWRCGPDHALLDQRFPVVAVIRIRACECSGPECPVFVLPDYQ
jgi:hypothetical protein